MRAQDEAAGTTRVTVEGCTTPQGAPYICKLAVIDGKARQDVTLTAKRGDIEVTYSAKAVTVEGQVIRAAVHGAIVAALTEALPQIVGLVAQAMAPAPTEGMFK